MLPALSHIRNWIFDLDNTLYPVSANLFAMIDARIGEYVRNLLNCSPEEAHRIQKGYFHAHGTTLSGLMAEHGTDPHHYLADVHDVDMSVLDTQRGADRGAGAAAGAQTGLHQWRRALCRQGARPAGARRDLRGDPRHSRDRAIAPSPIPRPIRALCDAYGLDPAESLFVEDMARNLKPAKAIGMTTVWIDNGSEQTPDEDRSFIDYTVTDLGQWLHEILED